MGHFGNAWQLYTVIECLLAPQSLRCLLVIAILDLALSYSASHSLHT